MNFRDRIQTWAADRFDSVQYPYIRRVMPARPKTARNSAPRIPFGTLLTLFVVGIFSIALGTAMLAFLVFFFWPAWWQAVTG